MYMSCKDRAIGTWPATAEDVCGIMGRNVRKGYHGARIEGEVCVEMKEGSKGGSLGRGWEVWAAFEELLPAVC